MKLWSTPPLLTLTSQNETLNTSQSVKRAAKIETDPLFHYSATKLILLTTCGIRYDKWLQIWKLAARPDASPSLRHYQLNSYCQLFIWIRWKQILISATASSLCFIHMFVIVTFLYPRIPDRAPYNSLAALYFILTVTCVHTCDLPSATTVFTVFWLTGDLKRWPPSPTSMLLLSSWHMPTCKGKNRQKQTRGKENTTTVYVGFFAFLKMNRSNIILPFRADASPGNSG